MRKRRVRSESSEALISQPEAQQGGEGIVGKEGKRFFACYLLVSLSPRHKGQTYIGFTVNPRRRIRQHNGEIVSGAWRTKKKRPWEMVLCIYGFPTNVSALQFEWAWQHPNESLAVRKAAASFKSLSGIANKIKLAYTMLTLPAWQSLNITVNYFSTKYTNNSAGCPSLPEHMKVQVCPMDELPCYTELDVSLSDNEHDLDNKVCDEDGIASGDYETNVNKMADDLHKCSNEQEEDCAQTSGFNKSLVRTSSSLATSSSRIEEAAEDGDMIKGSSFELHRPARHLLRTIQAADVNRPPSSSCFVPHQVEIIDVSTPSPDCRTSLCSKKRRVCLEIIDLTKSPSFVQL